MREIKFRAFNDLHGMSQPFHLTDSTVEWRDKSGDLFASCGLDSLDAFDSIVMQFTGVYDKGKKEIYENDIVELPHWSPSHWLVSYSDANGAFCFRHNVEQPYDTCHQMRYLERAAVVGNIHESPELLKVPTP